MQLVIREANEGPFLTQVLRFGRDNERLSDQQLAAIKGKAVLMSLKFADKYYNKYKMHLLEQAAHDVIGVVSLGLQELSGRDNARALALLQAPEGPIKPFQKGWSMLISVSPRQTGNSLYGDVDARLLDKISSPRHRGVARVAGVREGAGRAQQEPPDGAYRSALLRQRERPPHHGGQAGRGPALPHPLRQGQRRHALKVKQDLKRKLAREIELDESWYDTDYLAAQLALMLAELPADMAAALRQELSPGFVPNLLHTLGFVRQYQQLQRDNASPEKLDNIEMRAGLRHPLLGWPLYHDF